MRQRSLPLRALHKTSRSPPQRFDRRRLRRLFPRCQEILRRRRWQPPLRGPALRSRLKAEGIKHRVRASQHFRSFWGAWRTIAGYEAIHMIRKGQAWGSAASSKLNCRVIEMTLADLKRRLLASSDVLDQASNVAVVKTS